MLNKEIKVTPEYQEIYDSLVLMKELLSEFGSIYVHIDWHVGPYVKILLDDIFGKQNFRNEIIWGYDIGGRSDNEFAKKHDNIFFYAKIVSMKRRFLC